MAPNSGPHWLLLTEHFAANVNDPNPNMLAKTSWTCPFPSSIYLIQEEETHNWNCSGGWRPKLQFSMWGTCDWRDSSVIVEVMLALSLSLSRAVHVCDVLKDWTATQNRILCINALRESSDHMPHSKGSMMTSSVGLNCWNMKITVKPSRR